MEYKTIEYVKQHSRIDFDCEDSLLELYATGAEETVAALLNRGKTVAEMVASLTEEYGKLPSAIIHATLMLVEQSYHQRGPVWPQNLNLIGYSFDMMIKPYMRL